jgi:hypothetical protein
MATTTILNLKSSQSSARQFFVPSAQATLPSLELFEWQRPWGKAEILCGSTNLPVSQLRRDYID